MLACSELGQLLAVLRRALARDVQQVVADEDAGEVDVGPQPPELRVDLAVVRVELIELSVDVLRLARRREHRHAISSSEAAEAEGGDQPGLEWHTRNQPEGCFKRTSAGGRLESR